MTYIVKLITYNKFGDNMKVKVFDEAHEKDLETSINDFIEDVNVIDIKYQVAVGIFSEEQIYCFSALVMYEEAH